MHLASWIAGLAATGVPAAHLGGLQAVGACFLLLAPAKYQLENCGSLPHPA
jgi:hypothetical protein